MICQLKFGIIYQFSERMLRATHDLSGNIWNHLSEVIEDVETKR